MYGIDQGARCSCKRAENGARGIPPRSENEVAWMRQTCGEIMGEGGDRTNGVCQGVFLSGRKLHRRVARTGWARSTVSIDRSTAELPSKLWPGGGNAIGVYSKGKFVQSISQCRAQDAIAQNAGSPGNNPTRTHPSPTFDRPEDLERKKKSYRDAAASLVGGRHRNMI